MDNEKLTEMIREALEDKKAEDIRLLHIGELSEIADYFILATASNPNQMEALVDHVDEKMNQCGIEARNIEGSCRERSDWILMDYNDIVVHIFTREGREFYHLEKIWSN